MYNYHSFLGYGIIVSRQELKMRSPYREAYLFEHFEKKQNIVYMERAYEMSKVFIGFILNPKSETMVEEMRKAEKEFPNLYEKIFSAPMSPHVIKPKMYSKSGDIWED